MRLRNRIGASRAVADKGGKSGLMRTLRQRRPIQMRFAAIWFALIALLVLSAIIAPRSLLPSSILAIIPFAAFLAIAAMGESLVLMARGIDLSIPAIVALSSTIILGVSGGDDGSLLSAVILALVLSVAVGTVSGTLVAVFKLNPLVVTLAVGTILTGGTLWYRQGIAQESRVPPLLADLGEARILGLNFSVWVAIALVVLLAAVLRHTSLGRRFIAVGANPRAAMIAGLGVARFQIAAYASAAFLYGVTGILLSAFIRNPTLDVGAPYLLALIAAAVLAGTALTGGIGSMVAIGGAALFLTQLGQLLRILGLSTAVQFMINGGAIAVGMGLASLQMAAVRETFARWLGRSFMRRPKPS